MCLSSFWVVFARGAMETNILDMRPGNDSVGKVL